MFIAVASESQTVRTSSVFLLCLGRISVKQAEQALGTP